MCYLLTLIVACYFSTINAQEVVSTQGNSYSNGTGSIDYTIGEVVINTVSDGTNDLTQGFHQTDWNFVGVEDHVASVDATVYPNPIDHTLNIKSDYFEDVSYTLYDATGRIVMNDILSATLTSFDVSALAPGAYSLRLTDKNQTPLKTFKLVKYNQ